MVFTFSVLVQKNSFWTNLVKKIKIVSLSRNSIPKVIWIYGIQGWCSLFQFLTENTFLGKFGPKNQNCQFELKFRTRLIWICRTMYNIYGVYFSVLDEKNSFWANLVQKIKVVSLSWNLVPRLIWICGIQWWCSLFSFWPKFGPKIQNCLFKEKFDTKTNSNMQNSMVVSILSVLDWK